MRTQIVVLALIALATACSEPTPKEPTPPDASDPTALGACQITCSPVQYENWVDGDKATVSTTWGLPDSTCTDPAEGFLSSCTEIQRVTCAECAALARTSECVGEVYALETLILRDDAVPYPAECG
jgi:hypothetical protein